LTETIPTQRSDFGQIWKAVEGWLPAAYSQTYRTGVTGEVIRGSGQVPIASDLTHLLIPGLAALGVEAHLMPLPPEDANLERFLTGSDAAVLLFGFGASLEFLPPEEIDDATPLPRDADPAITAQARFVEVTANGLSWQNADGAVERAEAATLRTRFSHVLSLEKSGTKGLRRRRSLQSALHRWLAWQAAYPERAPREADLTDPACGLAAGFLAEAVGTRHDFVSNRLRYAARCFEAAQIERAFAWLQEAALAEWQLPAATAEALLAAPDLPLADVLRRELIYLARAGTPTLKTLAARRLTPECHHPDARKTLHQLCFDRDPWVRAAARPVL
jgi:hypothetical protein